MSLHKYFFFLSFPIPVLYVTICPNLSNIFQEFCVMDSWHREFSPFIFISLFEGNCILVLDIGLRCKMGGKWVSFVLNIISTKKFWCLFESFFFIILWAPMIWLHSIRNSQIKELPLIRTYFEVTSFPKNNKTMKCEKNEFRQNERFSGATEWR